MSVTLLSMAGAKTCDPRIWREVCNYPTDFSPMNAEHIDRLTLRGELLTRLLVAYYLPEL